MKTMKKTGLWILKKKALVLAFTVKAISCLILVTSFVSTNAQERSFKKFRQLKDKTESKIWLLPSDVDQALDSLRLEALNRQFDLGYGHSQDLLVDWLDFTIGYSDRMEYADVFREWEEILPIELVERLKRYGARNLKGHKWYYFEVFALTNDKGNVLSVYFRVHPQIVDLLKESELQWLSDTIKRKKIKPNNFDFRRWKIGQGEEAVKRVKEIPDSNVDERLRIMCEFEEQRQHCVYGIIHLCGVGGEAVVPIKDYPNIREKESNE